MGALGNCGTLRELMRLALLVSTALAGARAFVDTSKIATATITDLHKSKHSSEAPSNNTAFHASKASKKDDFWRLKPNNGSPYLCDVSLYDWFGKLANETGKSDKIMTILDVGGGYGEKGDMIEKMHPKKFKYSCVDVTAQGRCTEFDGSKMPHADRSFDIVTFVYSLHHAGDAVFSLLREAKRVAKTHVVVLDDLMGTNDHTLDFQFGHGGCQVSKDEPRVCMFHRPRVQRDLLADGPQDLVCR